jgi:hypothetical protein
VRDYVQSLRLRMHPDKYRFGATECGVDFVGFVMYPDGRVRMRDANLRRFARRFRQQAWQVRRGRMALGDLANRTRCWVAHASHAQSYHLRQDLFRDIELLVHREMNNRGLRGGAFNNTDNNLQSSNRNNNNPTSENNNIGFRVSRLRKAAPA